MLRFNSCPRANSGKGDPECKALLACVAQALARPGHVPLNPSEARHEMKTARLDVNR